MAVAATLRLLFPTDFSRACVDAGRAIAPLVEAGRLDVTAVHVVAPGDSVVQARQALDGFRREAGGLGHAAGVVWEAADASATLAAMTEQHPFDLILSPSSGRRGLRRVMTPSFRGSLMARTPVPLWTAGSAPAIGRMGHRVQNVACLVHWDHAVAARVRTAARFAVHAGARLHLIDVVPPIDDGTLAYVLYTDRPLSTAVSMTRMRAVAAGHAGVEVHATAGRRRGALRRLLRTCEADVLFVSGEEARAGLVRHRVARHLDGLPCPVICVGAGADAWHPWPFERSASGMSQVTWAAERFGRRLKVAS